MQRDKPCRNTRTPSKGTEGVIPELPTAPAPARRGVVKGSGAAMAGGCRARGHQRRDGSALTTVYFQAHWADHSKKKTTHPGFSLTYEGAGRTRLSLPPPQRSRHKVLPHWATSKVPWAEPDCSQSCPVVPHSSALYGVIPGLGMAPWAGLCSSKHRPGFLSSRGRRGPCSSPNHLPRLVEHRGSSTSPMGTTLASAHPSALPPHSDTLPPPLLPLLFSPPLGLVIISAHCSRCPLPCSPWPAREVPGG